MLLDARLPYSLRRGIPAALSLRYADAAGVAVVPSAASPLEVYDGGTALATSVITPGATNTTTILAATFESLAYGTRLDLRWPLTIAGVLTVVPTTAYVVRSTLEMVLTDDDLDKEFTDLAALTGFTSFEDDRVTCFERIQRWLYATGKRPFLVLDSYRLYDLHLAMTLDKICWRAWNTTNEPSWKARAEDYRETVKALKGPESELMLTIAATTDTGDAVSETSLTPQLWLGGVNGNGL